MKYRTVNWDHEAELAAQKTLDQLHDALGELRRSYESADARDRELGTCDGGYYRDLASIVHKEIQRRMGGNVCRHCGK
jgi:hypothetical protein